MEQLQRLDTSSASLHLKHQTLLTLCDIFLLHRSSSITSLFSSLFPLYLPLLFPLVLPLQLLPTAVSCTLHLSYPFFALNMLFMTPLTNPTTVKVPPTRAHMDVTNSYQCFPFFFITTAMGDRSYEKRASGTSSSVYWNKMKLTCQGM